MTPEQKKGEHGTVETVVVGGVRRNKEEVEAEKKGKTAAEVDAEPFDKATATKAELRAELDKHKVEYSNKSTADELRELIA